eukprot:4257532-Ditylum_brightwellii.AAC.1
MVVATTPQDKNGLAGPTRLLCLPSTQLSPKAHSSQGRSNMTSASFGLNIRMSGNCPITIVLDSMCYMWSTQNHQGRTVRAFTITFQRYPQAVC